MKKRIPLLMVLILLSAPFALADSPLGQFVDNLIPDSVSKSLQAMQVFLYDFMAFMLDIFTIILFIVWMLCIAGIVYVIYWIVSLPKKIGAKNFHDAIMKLSMMVWEFMR